MKVLQPFAIFMLLFACAPADKENEKPTVKNGIIKVYREDGRLHKELAYKNDTLHGLSKVYHPNGKLYLETEWANNKRHGLTKQYFQSGILYSETHYDSGRITGTLKKYHKDGKLKAEVPYNKGMECAGLKEYILNGDPRPYYPSIVIKTEDKIKTEGNYYLKFSISERVRRVTFYRGTLRDNCLHSELEKLHQSSPEDAMLVYPMGRGQYFDETENFIAKIETIAGNMLVVQKSFHVKIQREF